MTAGSGERPVAKGVTSSEASPEVKAIAGELLAFGGYGMIARWRDRTCSIIARAASSDAAAWGLLTSTPL